jgi:hypothetical protein
MPRRSRRKILGKRIQFEQARREKDLRVLLQELRAQWRHWRNGDKNAASSNQQQAGPHTEAGQNG